MDVTIEFHEVVEDVSISFEEINVSVSFEEIIDNVIVEITEAEEVNTILFDELGSPGVKGDKGNTGDVGATGAQGIQGEQGLKGDKGDTGDVGATGAQGIQGIKGDKGDTGDVGATGDQGIQGEQGIKGDKGDTGDVGATGSQGIQGIQGIAGNGGADGAQGLKGDTGEQGIQGVQGLKGDQGDTGSQGIKGDQGIQGDTGNSSIIISESGNLGSTIFNNVTNTIVFSAIVPQEFINSFRGFVIDLSILKNDNLATCNIRVYFNNSVSLTGAVLVSTTTMTAASFQCNIRRSFFPSTTAGRYVATTATTSLFIDYAGFTTYTFSQLNFNPCYIIVAIQNTSGSEITDLKNFKMVKF